MNTEEKKRLLTNLAHEAMSAVLKRNAIRNAALLYKIDIKQRKKRIKKACSNGSKFGETILRGFRALFMADFFKVLGSKVLSLYAKAQDFMLEAERMLQENLLSKNDQEKYSPELDLLQMFLVSVEKKINQCYTAD